MTDNYADDTSVTELTSTCSECSLDSLPSDRWLMSDVPHATSNEASAAYMAFLESQQKATFSESQEKGFLNTQNDSDRSPSPMSEEGMDEEAFRQWMYDDYSTGMVVGLLRDEGVEPAFGSYYDLVEQLIQTLYPKELRGTCIWSANLH